MRDSLICASPSPVVPQRWPKLPTCSKGKSVLECRWVPQRILAADIIETLVKGRKETPMDEQTGHTPATPASTRQAGAAANKALVLEFYERVLIGGDIDAADEYMRADYIQHNPKVPGGLDGFKTYFKKLGERQRRLKAEAHQEISHVVAEGDFVAVFGSNRLKGLISLNYGYADLFRIQDGQLAEHWDVLQGESLLDELILAIAS
jgi:predicted SnoaL-like aldol condensation-catalyzing enzyme